MTKNRYTYTITILKSEKHKNELSSHSSYITLPPTIVLLLLNRNLKIAHRRLT